MVFSCGCLAIMTLYIITDSINSWCERAPLINTELISCAAYTGSSAQNCLELCSAAGWKCLIHLIPGLFPQMLKREQHECPGEWALTTGPIVHCLLWPWCLGRLSCVTVSLGLPVVFMEKVEASHSRSAGALKYRGLLQQWFLSGWSHRTAQENRNQCGSSELYSSALV